MPLPMVHLGVAHRYFGGKVVPDSFVMGSLAPDAIHMREGAGREDKLRTHFGGKSATLEHVKQQYAGFIAQGAGQELLYIKGYFAHVLTDYLWGLHVYADFKEQVMREGTAESEVKNRYYQDTDGVDFWLYETAPWKESLWESLRRAPAYALNPLVTEQEVDSWRWRTVRWFADSTNKPSIPPKFITPQIVEAFIRQAGDEIRVMLE
ncbi:hypothetical protein B9G55_22780 [Saccharibacillus sp. O16]|nr:hypothetical protein B9G55_22780 [Saccharibacillus sp. O16]